MQLFLNVQTLKNDLLAILRAQLNELLLGGLVLQVVYVVIEASQRFFQTKGWGHGGTNIQYQGLVCYVCFACGTPRAEGHSLA